MDATSYLQVVRARWRMIAVITIVCVAAVAALVYRATPTYRSSTQVLLSASSGTSASDLVSGSTFISDRLQSYTQLVDSPALVLQPVINQLGLDVTPSTLAKRVDASAPLNTTLIEIDVTDSEAARSAQIANAIATQFSKAVGNQQKAAGAKTGPVQVTVTEQATAPSAPIAPNKKVDLLAALVAGLILGLVLAAVRSALDPYIRRPGDLRNLTRTPVLAGLPYDRDVPGRPLVVQAHPRTPRAEAFRRLRTNLEFARGAEQARSILITSSLPGEGKTTVAANLALTMAAGGAMVALVETDLRRPRLADSFGLTGTVGLTDVLLGRSALENALQPWGNGQLTILASGKPAPNQSELLNSGTLRDTLTDLGKQFDYVIVDSPALLTSTDATVLAKRVDATVVVVARSVTKRAQLRQSFEFLTAVDANVVGVVDNLASSRGRGRRAGRATASRAGVGSRRAGKGRSGATKHVSRLTPGVLEINSEWDSLVAVQRTTA